MERSWVLLVLSGQCFSKLTTSVPHLSPNVVLVDKCETLVCVCRLWRGDGRPCMCTSFQGKTIKTFLSWFCNVFIFTYKPLRLSLTHTHTHTVSPRHWSKKWNRADKRNWENIMIDGEWSGRQNTGIETGSHGCGAASSYRSLKHSCWQSCSARPKNNLSLWTAPLAHKMKSAQAFKKSKIQLVDGWHSLQTNGTVKSTWSWLHPSAACWKWSCAHWAHCFFPFTTISLVDKNEIGLSGPVLEPAPSVYRSNI